MNASYPNVRLRRLRQSAALRRLFEQEAPSFGKFLWPVFVVAGHDRQERIEAMPGQFRWSVDRLIGELGPHVQRGLGGILLFGVPDAADKQSGGQAAWRADGIVQQAVRRLRPAYPELVIATDVCLCAYTDHGHCGLLDRDGLVDNDGTNAVLARVAVSHAAAGAQVVAPSAMMDGQVAALRQALDEAGLSHTILMSYSTKFASALYGPFRQAERSAPTPGDRRGHQAPHTDLRQALRESEMDAAEGADILMIKPSWFYLDVLTRLREQTRLPIAAYNVSGEYAMVAAAAERGWCDLGAVVRESIHALTRAGADIVISYWASRYEEFFGKG